MSRFYKYGKIEKFFIDRYGVLHEPTISPYGDWDWTPLKGGDRVIR